MIANNWFECNDARKWACLIAMMDCKQVLWLQQWLQMQKFNCDNGHMNNWVHLQRWLQTGMPFDCNKFAQTQQSTSSIAKTVAKTSECINCKQKACAIATVDQWDQPNPCLQEQIIVVMVARANNHDGVCESEQSRLCLREQTIMMLFARANNCNDVWKSTLQSSDAINCDNVCKSKWSQWMSKETGKIKAIDQWYWSRQCSWEWTSKTNNSNEDCQREKKEKPTIN